MYKHTADFYDLELKLSPLVQVDTNFYRQWGAKTGPRALELACGTGRISRMLASMKKQVWAVDISEEMLNNLTKHVAQSPPDIQERLHLVHADMVSFQLPYRFDFITIPFRSFNFLTTREQQRRCFQNVHAHIKPNGVFIVHIHQFKAVASLPTKKEIVTWDIFDDENNCHVKRSICIQKINKKERLLEADFRIDVTTADNQQQTFNDRFKLHFPKPDTIYQLLKETGWLIEEKLGSVTGQSVAEGSDLILVCRPNPLVARHQSIALHNQQRLLIPPFIHDAAQQDQVTGEFETATLFVDISGFTPLTQTLMTQGKDGAEILTNILNSTFDTLVTKVHAHGGFISSFAGDAFTAQFPLKQQDGLLQALHVAQFTQRFFEQKGDFDTKYGQFQLAVAIGLSVGNLKWQIIHTPNEKSSYYFYGQAIDLAVTAQRLANVGQIILHNAVSHKLPFQLHTTPLQPDAYHLLNPNQLPPTPYYLQQQIQDISFSSQFTPEITHQTAMAEFRQCCYLFINFSINNNNDLFIQYIQSILRLARQFGGYFNKIDYGDKGWIALIIFGAPVAHENSRERALKFVFELRNVDLPSLKWRAGITWGTAYTGFIGSYRQGEYTAIGNMVNLAARLTTDANWNDILVSQDLSQIPGFISLHHSHKQYKGFKQPINTYRIQHMEQIEAKFFESPLIERETEIKQLLTFAEPIWQGQFAGVAYITGIGGVGKSHLAYELGKQLTRQDDITWFTAQVDQIFRNSLNPFIYFLRIYFDQAPERKQNANRQRFNQIFNQLLANLEAINQPHPQQEDIFKELQYAQPILAGALGLADENSIYFELDNDTRYQNTLFALKNLLLAESCLQPIFFLLEDTHWLDDASKQFLPFLVRHIENFPIYLVITIRTGEGENYPHIEWDDSTHTHITDLHGLSVNGLTELCLTHLNDDIDHRLAQLIYEKTEGTPLYAHQYMLYFQENNQLTHQDGRWVLKEANSQLTELPQNIRSVIQARLDRLTATTKELVKIAAVLGREFPLSLLTTVAHQDGTIPQVDTKINNYTTEAVNKQIWLPVGILNYAFSYAYLRDAAYNLQFEARLQKLHGLIANAYEKHYTNNLNTYYDILAYHYTEANWPEKAIVYLIRAGQQAFEMSDYNQSLRLLQQANLFLAQLPQDQYIIDQQKTYYLLGEVLSKQGNISEAITMLNKSIKLAQKFDYTLGELPAQRAYGLALGQQGQLDEAKQHLERALSLAQQLQNSAEQAHSLYNLGYVVWRQNKPDKAKIYFEQGLDIARIASHRPSIARTTSGLALYTWIHQKDLNQAQLYLQHAYVVQEEVGNRNGCAGTLSNMGIIAYHSDDYPKAESYLTQAAATFSEIGNQLSFANVLIDLSYVYIKINQLTKANNILLESLNILAKKDIKPLILLNIIATANLYIAQNNFNLAKQYLAMALSHSKADSDVQREATNAQNLLPDPDLSSFEGLTLTDVINTRLSAKLSKDFS